MRITVFIGTLAGGGAERVVCNLANFLVKRGHEVDLLTLKDAVPVEPLVDGVKTTPLYMEKEGSKRIIKAIKMIIRLRRYMKKAKVDTYVVMLPLTTILMLLFAGLTKAPIIAAERADPRVYSKMKKWLLQHLAHRAKLWIFQTEEVKQWYMPRLTNVEVAVLPNAVNPAFLREQYTGVRENTIVGAGRLTEQKRFDLLIRAFAAISAEFPEYYLTIYGKGPKLSELQNLAESLGIKERVVFPGYIADMPQRMEKASMFVLASDYEGMPNVLIEAMALGLPCVATDCGGGGARYLVKDGVNGLLIPIRDEAAMADAMRSILNDPEKAAQLGAQARLLQEKLSPECVYSTWETYIQKISGQ